jgi:hypothetical protein
VTAALLALVLHWTATGDDSLAGRADHYDLRVATAAPTDTAAWWSAAAPVPTGPPADTGRPDSASIDLPPGTYWFALVVFDDAGNASALSNIASQTVAPQPSAPDAIADLAIGPSLFGSSTHDWVALVFTAPARASSYSVWIIDHLDGRWNMAASSQPVTGSPAPIPRPAGQPDSVWIYRSRNALPRHVRVGASNPAGLTPSNSVMFAIGDLGPMRPDTIYVDLSRGDMDWNRSRITRPGVWLAEFRRAPGDSTWMNHPWYPLPRICSQETFQVWDKPRACAATQRQINLGLPSPAPFASWALRGAVQPCSTSAPAPILDLRAVPR